MGTRLVYLHIPKSAGTSHRFYLSKVYGEDNFFWYGIHARSGRFDPQDIEGFPAIGGHKTLSFYPRSLDALYSSVVRDPIERAVSLYNYYTSTPEDANAQRSVKHIKELQKWHDLGIDPTSLVRSIENCDAFRVEVSNMQCKYLSRYGATWEGVKQSLKETDMVIGIFEDLSKFNGFFQHECGFPIENRSRANRGRSGYSSPIYQEEGAIELLRSINSEDQALHDFVRLAHGGLFVGANNISGVRERVLSKGGQSTVQPDEPLDWEKVHLFGKGVVNLAGESAVGIPLILKNNSSKPVVLSSDDDCYAAISWRIQTSAGKPLEGLEGIVKADQFIPAWESKSVTAVVDTTDIELPDTDSLFMQFGIYHEGEWIWDKLPMNSTWLKVHT